MSNAMKSIRSVFSSEAAPKLFHDLSAQRVKRLASALESYIAKNLVDTINRRSTLQDYRTNPYVLMAIASTMKLDDPLDFAQFIANTKLYMGLETSFGKSIENVVTAMYPINATVG